MSFHSLDPLPGKPGYCRLTVTSDNGDSVSIDLPVSDVIDSLEKAYKMIDDRPTREHFSTRPRTPPWRGKVKPPPDDVA